LFLRFEFVSDFEFRDSNFLKIMPRLRRAILWLGWIVLITAPIIWLKVYYDLGRGDTFVRPQAERWRFLTTDLPRWLGRNWLTLLILAAVGAVLYAASRFWEQRGWRDRLGSAIRESPAFQFRWIGIAALILAGFAVPPFAFSDKYINLAVMVGIYIILAQGLNLTVGMTGLLVLGYAGFYAVGAYTFALMNFYWGASYWMAFLPAMVVGALFGLVLGLPSFRLRGDYLAIVTLGFGETVRYILKNWSGFTQGDRGVIIKASGKVPSFDGLPFWPHELSRLQVTYFLVFLFCAASIFAVNRLMHSRIGRAWIAIREDETAASAMGIHTVRYKLLAFMLSAIWAAVAGVLYTANTGYVDPETFKFDESVMILIMVVLGGMGSGPGAIVGAAVVWTLQSVLRDKFPAFSDYRLMVFGALLIVMMIYRPQGLIGSMRRKVEMQEAKT
jgi:branched-chain amino acid transport system permease protein